MPPADRPEAALDLDLLVAAIREAISTVPPRRSYSVAELAERWRIGQDKVLAFIRKGDLVAVNVAAHTSGRPQWRVTPEEVARFESKRTSAPPPKPTRRKRATGKKDWFPD
jgi:hypothetical protein